MASSRMPMAESQSGNLKPMRLSFALRGRWDDPPSPAFGAIAQLAERLDRTQEVGGSNPPGSIFRARGSSRRALCLSAAHSWLASDAGGVSSALCPARLLGGSSNDL